VRRGARNAIKWIREEASGWVRKAIAAVGFQVKPSATKNAEEPSGEEDEVEAELRPNSTNPSEQRRKEH